MALETISKLPARQFRTMLRLLSSGIYVSQAHEILARRSAAGLEVQADDVNTLLSSCAFNRTQRAITTYLTCLKKNGLLIGHNEHEIESGCEMLLTCVENGIYPDLEDARKKRSPEMHPQNAKFMSKNKVSKKVSLDDISGTGDDSIIITQNMEGGRKRKRIEDFGKDHHLHLHEKEEQKTFIDLQSLGNESKPLVNIEEKRYDIVEEEKEKVKENLTGHETVDTTTEVTRESQDHNKESHADDLVLSSTLFKQNLESLFNKFVPRETEWAKRRFIKVNEIFLTMTLPPIEILDKDEENTSERLGPLRKLRFTGLGISPNARSYVILLYSALEAGDINAGKHFFNSLITSGLIRIESLYEFFQPAFLFRLSDANIISQAQLQESLTCFPDTPKWFFLKAVAEAMLGDQYGSKHGSVVTRNGKYLTHGRNHRFGLSNGDPHLRVMHSEIHALSKLSSKLDAIGSECWIVELDGQGVGYEEARPCPMCNKGVHNLGVYAVHYSSHSGIKSEKISHKPGLKCESYEFALTASYPQGTFNPNEHSDDPTFDFFSSKLLVDPGRGKGTLQLQTLRSSEEINRPN